jgi:hypothetical protein
MSLVSSASLHLPTNPPQLGHGRRGDVALNPEARDRRSSDSPRSGLLFALVRAAALLPPIDIGLTRQHAPSARFSASIWYLVLTSAVGTAVA